jgi:hypothetical protein
MNTHRELEITFNPFSDHDEDDGVQPNWQYNHSSLVPPQPESSHPLKSAGLGKAPVSAGITRPHLARMLNPGLEESQEDSEIPGDIATPEEKVVLVHEVCFSPNLCPERR